MMLNERRSPPTAEQVAVRQAFAAWKAERAKQPIPAERYGMKCCLCGGPSDRFTCAGCDVGLTELGL